MPAVTLAALLRETRQRLTLGGIDNPGFEARRIVEHFTDTTQTLAITHPDCEIENRVAELAVNAALRRCSGEPLHRILGYREFYGLKLVLSSETLEPRPDTEVLVDLVLGEVLRIHGAKTRCRILDLGTGTGAIALALLSGLPNAEAVGTDISEGALETARRNAEVNGISERFTGLKSDWFQRVDGQFDVIVSNPPYIPTSDLENLAREVREHDPRAALDGGPDGLRPYRLIARDARARLTEEGLVAVETGYDQKAAVAAIFAAEGFALLKSVRDLGGNDRAMLFGPSESWEKTLGKPSQCR